MKCPNCGFVFPEPAHDYVSGPTVYCEDCGDHPAEPCPRCHDLVDLVMAKDES